MDSDGFVGLFHETDAHHEKARQYFNHAAENRDTLILTNYVAAEAGTVISHKAGQDMARRFFDLVETYPTIHIDEQLHRDTIELFKQQGKKGTSIVDCSNVVVMRRFNIPKIFSFDKFYTKFDLERAA